MELQTHLAGLAEQGILPLVVSYDSQEVLAGFAEDHGIEYPLLSDEGSEVIRRYGILNTLIDEGEENHGIPFPGTYLVGRDGRVEEKRFHREYRVRESGATVLRSLGGRPELAGYPSVEGGDDQLGITATLAAPDFKFEQVVDLVVRLRLAPGLHLYGEPQDEPVQEGLYPTTVSVTSTAPLRVGEPRYPATQPHHVEGIDAELPAFVGELEVVVPLISDSREGVIPLDVEVSYQACSDRECYIPRTERLHLDVPTGALVPGRPAPA